MLNFINTKFKRINKVALMPVARFIFRETEASLNRFTHIFEMKQKKKKKNGLSDHKNYKFIENIRIIL